MFLWENYHGNFFDQRFYKIKGGEKMKKANGRCIWGLNKHRRKTRG